MAVELRPGVFLLADPALTDPNFEESVVLLCAHGEQGSMGLIVNRLLEVPLRQALPELTSPAAQDLVLSWGGPVGLNQLHILHGGKEPGSQSVPVCPGVALGAAVAELEPMIQHGVPLRFFVGYSGWDAGQLAAEMETGTWRLADAGAQQVFSGAPEKLWTELIARQDPDLAWLQHRPADPSLN